MNKTYAQTFNEKCRAYADFDVSYVYILTKPTYFHHMGLTDPTALENQLQKQADQVHRQIREVEETRREQ